MTNQAYQHTKTDQHTHTDRHTTDNKHWIGLGLKPNLINIIVIYVKYGMTFNNSNLTKLSE